MRRQRSKDPGSKVQIPIPPMLDMTFQLLIFFMLWFKPSSLEGQMDLSLPTDKPTIADKNEAKAPDAAIDDDPDVEKPPEVTVIIKAILGDDPRTLGQISAISIQLKEDPTPTAISEEGADTDRLLFLLQEKLKKVRETLENQKDVMMRGERRLRWQYVVRVRDACQKAGFTNAHFSPPPDA
jgi:biopolymer transport protein ExbD